MFVLHRHCLLIPSMGSPSFAMGSVSKPLLREFLPLFNVVVISMVNIACI